MSDSDPPKRRVDTNVTIQIDLDQVTLYDPSGVPLRRTSPPPLPAAPDLSAAPAPQRSAARTIFYVALFVVLIGTAIAGGVMVGLRARGDASTSPIPSASTVASAAAAQANPAPSGSTSGPTLTLPTIEMR